MDAFRTMDDLIAHLAERWPLPDRITTALYPSAGSDTKPLTFTHPEVLAHRGAGEVPSPDVFVLVDRGAHSELRFEDHATAIETLDSGSGSAFGAPISVHWVRLRSTSLTTKECAVIFARGENEQLGSTWRSQGWVPDMFIGVCDGCRYGGNKKCVNRLDLGGMPPAEAAKVRVPRWWITEHFSDAIRNDHLAVGGYIDSVDPSFPLRFRMLALLSENWGTYDDESLSGATLFAVERRAGLTGSEPAG